MNKFLAALALALVAGCSYDTKCTDPCSESVFTTVGANSSVQCCPNQHAEFQYQVIICRCN